uniref:DUF4774 domain-containing protein n=1 Tax=Syphacia muris TaxID=451379 RepID=A0A0N5AJ19_9BILA
MAFLSSTLKQYHLLDGEDKLSIIEKHVPKYHIETKVAAPIYILPKHSTTVREQDLPQPPVIIKTGIIVKPTSGYKTVIKQRQQQLAVEVKENNPSQQLKSLVMSKLKENPSSSQRNFLPKLQHHLDKVQSLLEEPQTQVIRQHHHYFHNDLPNQQEQALNRRVAVPTLVPVHGIIPSAHIVLAHVPYFFHRINAAKMTQRDIERETEKYIRQNQRFIAQHIPFFLLYRNFPLSNDVYAANLESISNYPQIIRILFSVQYQVDGIIDDGYNGMACGYGPARILENHKPQYDIETKVAAPVYILPKHGSVVDKNTEFPKLCSEPKVMVKPIALPAPKIIVASPKVVRPTVPVVVHTVAPVPVRPATPLLVRRPTRPVVMNAKCL